MQRAMNLEQLLIEIRRQGQNKKDRLTSTKDNIRMVPAMAGEGDQRPKLVLLRDGSVELERFGIDDFAHQQIAGRLEIPWKYYNRLLTDHPDLVIAQVNALFEREPSTRMIRILDNNVRAFLSDRYLRLDNAEVLEYALPQIVKGGFNTELLASHVDAHGMHIKCVFRDQSLAREITTARGEPRVMRPGFRLSNSETGQGAYRVEAFFYDSYCKNGAVFGRKEIFSFERNHLGGRLIEGVEYSVVSESTQRLQGDLLKSQTHDTIAALCSPERVDMMADALRRAATSVPVKHPVAAVDMAIKALPLRESERESILETFLRDQDYTQYGLAAAVTEVANSENKATFKRACELETIGGLILDLNPAQWDRYVEAELAA